MINKLSRKHLLDIKCPVRFLNEDSQILSTIPLANGDVVQLIASTESRTEVVRKETLAILEAKVKHKRYTSSKSELTADCTGRRGLRDELF
jgi:tRNA 2-selenouridine synthase SelU